MNELELKAQGCDQVREVKVLLSLPSVWNSESHQACLSGRVVTNEDKVNVNDLELKAQVVIK